MSLRQLTCTAGVLMTLVMGSPAAATTYEELKADGFATSRYAQLGGGTWGWYVARDDQKYFCSHKVALMRRGNRIGNFLLGGHFMSMTIAQYRRESSGDPMRFPRYDDIVAGRPPAWVVGKCKRSR